MDSLDLGCTCRLRVCRIACLIFPSTSLTLPRTGQERNGCESGFYRRHSFDKRNCFVPHRFAIWWIYLVHLTRYFTDRSPWKSVQVIVTMMIGLGLLVAFSVWESVAKHPMISSQTFTNKVPLQIIPCLHLRGIVCCS